MDMSQSLTGLVPDANVRTMKAPGTWRWRWVIAVGRWRWIDEEDEEVCDAFPGIIATGGTKHGSFGGRNRNHANVARAKHVGSVQT